MTEEQEGQEPEVAVSEPPEVESQETPQEEPKMVPLAALEAERRKRQDAEGKSQLYQEYLMRAQEEAKKVEEPEEPEDSLVEKKQLKEMNAATKREILESVYQDMNPEAVRTINKYLNPILERKPWLTETIKAAQNRYARAYEIVTDYLHLVEDKPQQKQVSSPSADAQRIVQNAQKPKSPVEIGKSQAPGSLSYLKSIQGKKEFREYRQKVLRGEV